MPAPLTLKY